MKPAVCCFVFSLLVTGPAIASNKTDREHDGFAGPVREVRLEKSILAKKSGDWVEEPRVPWQLVKYDSNGRLTERIFYSSDGSVWSKIVYNYDNEGNRNDVAFRLIKKGSSKADGSDQNQGLTEFMRSRRTFKYDSGGNRTEEVDYREGKPSQRTVYRVEANGFVNELIQYAPNGLIQFQYSNKYGENGSIIEQHRHQSPSANARTEWYSYEFDSMGNWTKRVSTAYALSEGKRPYDRKEVIYRTLTYDLSQSAVEKGRAIDRSTDLTGGTSFSITQPLIIRKSGGVLQGSAIRRVEPSYPPEAVAQRVSGEVVVEVTVDEDGNVMAARALSGPDLLREAAVSAAKGWKFRATELSGMPVKVIGTITFNFNLR